MDEIIAALESINHQGQYYSEKQVTTTNLDIKHNKLGTLSYPIEARQIKALIAEAKPAAFGWKDQTIIDKSVRNVWEIPKSRVRIGLKQWRAKFDKVLDEFKKTLGLPNKSTLEAQFHNMLVYEPGCFFRPHQDSEKAEDMIATMVIVLPCEHTGGELVIQHNQEQVIFKPRKSKIPKLSCVVFYADCRHEVKEVTSGYRITLTYNLVLKNYKGGLASLYTDNFNDRLSQAMASYFKNPPKESWSRSLAPKVVYLLDHEYTQASLDWDLLKNSDRDRVTALLEVANKQQLDVHLVLADMQETWECQFDYNEYKYRRKNRYYDDDDTAVPDYIVDSNTVLKNWIDRNSNLVDIADFSPSSSEICCTHDNELFSPYESEYERWSGNAGNTLDRWYHRAAIILWRKQDYYAILFEMDKPKFINNIFKIADRPNPESELKKVLKYAAPYWKEYALDNHRESNIDQTLKIVVKVNDANISKYLVKPYSLTSFNTQYFKLWAKVISLYGEDWMVNILDSHSKSQGLNTYDRSLFEALDLLVKLLIPLNYHLLVHWLITYQYKFLKKQHNQERYETVSNYRCKLNTRISQLCELYKAVVANQDEGLANTLIFDAVSDLNKYPALELLTLYEIMIKYKLDDKWGKASLKTHLLRHYQIEYQLGQKSNDNWQINEKINCRCNYCQVVNEFLKNSNKKQQHFPLTQEARSHVSREIVNAHLPVKTDEERTGRPYKLVVTKNSRIHKEAKMRYLNLEQAIQKLTA